MSNELTTNRILLGDCLDVMRTLPDGCVDLVLCSPPYEAARTYGMGFKLKGQDWVDWCVERFVECCRVCRGLVAWVVEGQTRNYRYSAAPALLMADLHRKGVNLRKPPVFHRVGIPGSGGPDWLRNDWEWIICATPPGKLLWSDNTAMGHPPKWAPGGAMSNRNMDGVRKNARGYSGKAGVNQWGHSIGSGATVVDDGGVVRSKGKRPSHVAVNGHGVEGAKGGIKTNRRVMTTSPRGSKDNGGYNIPVLANPGNVIKCIVGGGVMGSDLASENEAPYPEALAEFFIKSFCPPDGIVLDCFSGSGTTIAVAEKNGRRWLGIDVRDSQVELSGRRIEEAKRPHKAKVKRVKAAKAERSLFD